MTGAVVSPPAPDRPRGNGFRFAVAVGVAAVLVLAVACPVLAFRRLVTDPAPDCPPDVVSEIRTDRQHLPAALVALAVREVHYVDYTWCYEFGIEGFVVLEAADAQILRARYDWRQGTLAVANPALRSFAPSDPVWLASPTWERSYGHPGWRIIMLNEQIDVLYFRDAYEGY
jgi:hypothetical protein